MWGSAGAQRRRHGRQRGGVAVGCSACRGAAGPAMMLCRAAGHAAGRPFFTPCWLQAAAKGLRPHAAAAGGAPGCCAGLRPAAGSNYLRAAPPQPPAAAPGCPAGALGPMPVRRWPAGALPSAAGVLQGRWARLGPCTQPGRRRAASTWRGGCGDSPPSWAPQRRSNQAPEEAGAGGRRPFHALSQHACQRWPRGGAGRCKHMQSHHRNHHARWNVRSRPAGGRGRSGSTSGSRSGPAPVSPAANHLWA